MNSAFSSQEISIPFVLGEVRKGWGPEEETHFLMSPLVELSNHGDPCL